MSFEPDIQCMLPGDLLYFIYFINYLRLFYRNKLGLIPQYVFFLPFHGGFSDAVLLSSCVGGFVCDVFFF